MDVIEAKGRLLELLDRAGFRADRPDVRLAWEVFKQFVREPVETPEDSVVFQCGVGFMDEGRRFYVDFLRQFTLLDPQGEYARMEQLRLRLRCRPNADTRELETNLWAYEFPTLEEFFAAVEALPEFQVALAQGPWTFQLDQSKPE